MTIEVVRGLGFDEYQSRPGISATALKRVTRSPKHYRAEAAKPSTPTPSMLLGTLAHELILGFRSNDFGVSTQVPSGDEPPRISRYPKSDDKIAVWKGESKRGNAWAAFKDLHAGKLIVDQDEYLEAYCMRSAVFLDPAFKERFAEDLQLHPENAEVSIFWKDRDTGRAMKARPDFVSSDGWLVDFKTTRDPSPRAFRSQATSLHYYLQVAFYFDAVNQAAREGLMPFDELQGAMVFAIESKSPWDVVPYAFDFEARQAGREQYREAIEVLRHCEASGVWPGLAGGGVLGIETPWGWERDYASEDSGEGEADLAMSEFAC